MRRIADKSHSGHVEATEAGTSQKAALRRVMLGAILVTFGGGLVKAANLNYQSLREDSSIATAAGLGFIAFAMVAAGLVLSLKGLKEVKATARSASAAPSAAPAPIVASATGRGPNLVLMVVAVLVIFIGSGVMRFANENYERLRADGGTELTLAFGIAAFATIIYGVVLFWRSFRRRPAQLSHRSEPLPPPAKSRLGPVLFGLALGIAACFSMFMASAARLVNPATDNLVSGLALLAALALTVLALLIGIIGLFLRGSALRRVPLYYLAGAILTYAAFRFFYIDLRNWPWFTALMQ